MEKVIKVKDLTISYGDTKVIDNISFDIEDVIIDGQTTGQIVAVLGQSGCGKSTLFRALAGLKDYDGSILLAKVLDDTIQHYVAPEAGMVGLVDQKYTMFRHRTVRSALSMVLKRKGKIQVTIDGDIDYYSKKLGIESILDKYPNELSGGQRQRAALLERLFNGNHYIILDEPFSGLDVKSKESAKSFMRQIVNEHELNNILFCTHNVNIAVEMADVIIVLSSHGTILKQINLREQGYVLSS